MDFLLTEPCGPDCTCFETAELFGGDGTLPEDDRLPVYEAIDAMESSVEDAIAAAYERGYAVGVTEGAREALTLASLDAIDAPDPLVLITDLNQRLDGWAPGISDDVNELWERVEALEAQLRLAAIVQSLQAETIADITEGHEARLTEIEQTGLADAALIEAVNDRLLVVEAELDL